MANESIKYEFNINYGAQQKILELIGYAKETPSKDIPDLPTYTDKVAGGIIKNNGKYLQSSVAEFKYFYVNLPQQFGIVTDNTPVENTHGFIGVGDGIITATQNKTSYTERHRAPQQDGTYDNMNTLAYYDADGQSQLHSYKQIAVDIPFNDWNTGEVGRPSVTFSDPIFDKESNMLTVRLTNDANAEDYIQKTTTFDPLSPDSGIYTDEEIVAERTNLLTINQVSVSSDTISIDGKVKSGHWIYIVNPTAADDKKQIDLIVANVDKATCIKNIRLSLFDGANSLASQLDSIGYTLVKKS